MNATMLTVKKSLRQKTGNDIQLNRPHNSGKQEKNVYDTDNYSKIMTKPDAKCITGGREGNVEIGTLKSIKGLQI